MKNIKDLLGSALPADLVESLQEAYETKVAEAVAEARKEVEADVEANFARRFDRDRDAIIESIDAMIGDALKAQADERAEEIERYTEARVAYHSAMVEGKKMLAKRLKESLTTAGDLINTRLSEEVSKLRSERAALIERAEKMNSDLEGAKIKIAEQHEKHVQKIDEFVTKQLRAELTEFHQDKQALVEQRVKLVAEGRKKLKETQDRFIAEAAGKVEKFVEENLKSNLEELREDLERHRENMFGRRIFEAVAAEYMTSYFAEDTEVRKLQRVLENKEQQIVEAKTAIEAAEKKLTEATVASEVSSRKVRMAEDRADRTKIMGELLANLKGEKRTVMENLLSTTKTTELRKSFDKLLPVVLAETQRQRVEPSVLSETKKAVKSETRTITGNATRSNRLLESAEEQNFEDNAEIDLIRHLAGLR